MRKQVFIYFLMKMRKQTKILCMQCTKTASSISPSHTNCCNKFHAQTQPTCLQRRISAGPTVLTRPGSMFGPLRTPTNTAQDTTITQSMPGQHVQASLHTYRHSTGHHDHTKYTWPVCSGLFAHLQTQHRTPRSHKVYLASMFRPLCTPTGHHNHTKYAWQVCSDLFAHLHTQHRTPHSHKVYLISIFRPLHTHLQAQHNNTGHKVYLISMFRFRPLHTPTSTAHNNHTKYAWSACLDLCTPSGTAHDITIAQSMPGQHVWTSSHTVRHNRTSQSYKVCLINMFGPVHTYRHSTGHHNHTKYTLSACSDLCTLSGTAQDTTITTKYALSARSDLCMPSGTSQSHKVWRFRATLHSKRFQEHQCHNEPKPCRLL